MTKKMKIKYAICLPLIILFMVLGALGQTGIIPGFWTIAAVIVIGVCIVVLQSEMTFFAPQKKNEQ